MPLPHHTQRLRAIRKNVLSQARHRSPRAGEICHCYTGLRHKGAQLLGRWPCLKVEGILIFEDGLKRRVFIDGNELTWDEKNALAWRDGRFNA